MPQDLQQTAALIADTTDAQITALARLYTDPTFPADLTTGECARCALQSLHQATAALRQLAASL